MALSLSTGRLTPSLASQGIWGQQMPSVKGHAVNILDFTGHMVSIAINQLRYYSADA